MKNLISMKEMKREEIEDLLASAYEMKRIPSSPRLKGKIMASCFFEPSTRTRLSFETAMKRLGGDVIGFSETQGISTQKGESLRDTIRVIGLYADLLVVRHPLEGASRAAAESTSRPVINAGDGANEHPSQTLLDLFSIHECYNKIDGLRIACVGDLLYGRTVHSLALALKHFDVRLYFVSPPTLPLPDSICDELKREGIPYSFHSRLDEVIGQCDILYMTRVQKERFTNPDEYLRVKDAFILTPSLLAKAKAELKVLHPLPRVGEIASVVDQSSHAYYFQQAENGLYMRQALLCKLLGS